MEVLKVENVVKQFGNYKASNDISFSARKGSVTGLLGPNGAGKTTMIRMITNILMPDSGNIFLFGEKIQPAHQNMIGYLPEERGLYKKVKVIDQLVYFAQLKGMDKKSAITAANSWLFRLDAMDWAPKKIQELSKGMQQKVQFIVTVLHEPKLLILDEPFSGFDPINAQLIKNEILELRDKGATIIFSTHNMGSVEELCDNIALINKAEKLLDGSVKDIRKQYKSNTYHISFKGNLMGFTNALWAGAELLDKKSDDDLHSVTVKLLRQNKPNDLLQAVLSTAEILSFQEIVPSMNDIFISVVENKTTLNTQSAFTE